MKITTVCLVVTLGIVTGSVVPNQNTATAKDARALRNTAMEEMVLGIIEGLRETMLTGTDDIPVMDPLEINRLHLDLGEIGLVDSHIAVEDAVAKYLSTFVVDDLSITMTSILLQRYSFVVEGHIPVLEIDAEQYDLMARVGWDLSVFGKGKAHIKIIEPRIKGVMEVGIGILGGISITFRSADFVFELGGFETKITGIFENDELEDFINAFLKNLIPELVLWYQPEISEFINSIIMGIGSIDLSSVTPYAKETKNISPEQWR